MEDNIVSLCTDKGIKKEYKIDNYLDGGAYGDVYKLDDNTCIKLMSNIFYFSDEVVRIVKHLKLDKFYEIYDLLYDSHGYFCGYTMKYYPKGEIDILQMPTSYTLDNLYELHKSFDKLSDNNVLVSDCYHENVILNDSGLTIIDVDLFRRETNISQENYYNLMYLFRDLYHVELNKMDYPRKDREYILGGLFDEKAEIEAVEKKLVRYKYPIDYVKDCYRGNC